VGARGERPDTDNLIALARLYSVSLDDLLNIRSGDALPSAIAPAALPTQGDSGMADGENTAFDTDGEKEKRPLGKIRRALLPIYPIIVTAVFVLLGMGFGIWHPAWILFMTIPVFYAGLTNCFPVLVTGIYLLVGFSSGVWHPTWLVFLTIPVFYTARTIAMRGYNSR
jgi:hypothetical protein